MNYLYVIVYIIYLLFGYSVATKLIDGETPRLLCKVNIFKRLLALSMITLLVNAAFYNDSGNITLYAVAVLLNVIVCVGYYIKFYPITDPLTWFFHIVWAIPIFMAPMFYQFKGEIDWTVIIVLILLLLVYKFTLEKYVYD